MGTVKFAVLALASACCASVAIGQQVFSEMGLTLQAPPLEKVAFKKGGGGLLRGTWTGTLGPAAVEIELLQLSSSKYGFSEATDVVASALDQLRNSKRGGDPSFQWEMKKLVPGAYGYAPYVQIASGAIRANDKIVGTRFELGGLLQDSGYAIEVAVRPAPPDKDAKAVLDWLAKCILYSGPVRTAQWTDEEAKARWEKFSPPSAQKKFEKPLRTAHYIILTNSSGGDKFGVAMEGCYAAIKKLYPFDEVVGLSLMPVFLFRTKDEYSEFYAKIASMPVAQAARSKGHAWKDYYATYFDAPNDPVHIHEATHQIFANRLALQGGGSWFQEGVAEYICTKKNDRNVLASLVKKERHVPLVEMIKTESLLYSAKENVSGEDQAENAYTEAALLIEFLHESKWAAPKFLEFIHVVGLTPDNDVTAIERAIKGVYGVDLKALEEKWVDYCKKR